MLCTCILDGKQWYSLCAQTVRSQISVRRILILNVVVVVVVVARRRRRDWLKWNAWRLRRVASAASEREWRKCMQNTIDMCKKNTHTAKATTRSSARHIMHSR